MSVESSGNRVFLPGDRERVREYLEINPSASVVEVLSRLSISSEFRSGVEEIIDEHTPTGGGGSSWRTNETNSVEGCDGPTAYSRAADFHREYPELARLPVTGVHGEKLNKRFVQTWRDEWESTPATEHEDPVTGVEEWYEPMTWGEAVLELLTDHHDKLRTTLNLVGRDLHGTELEHSKPAQTRWFASYQRQKFAEIKAWFREMIGGTRPSGGEAAGLMNDPHVVLITRTASSTPGGVRVPAVDHYNELRRSWEPVYHTLRNTMEALGREWQYDRRLEPHYGERGGGANHCYAHEHIPIIVDGEVDAEDFRSVVEKHVEVCEYAGSEAHELEKAVEVKPADDIDDPAAYVADYCGIKPVDLFERSEEYIGFAAMVSAANGRIISRSDAAGHAVAADRCKQRYESSKSEQDVNHGEEVVRSSKRGYDNECLKCGSPHGVEQGSLTPVRLSAPEVAADGGASSGGSEVMRRRELAERWPSAQAAAAVGEPTTHRRWRDGIREYYRLNPDAPPPQVLGALGLPADARELVVEIRHDLEGDPSVSVGFDRGLQWRLESVTVGDETYSASAGGGVDLVRVSTEGEWHPPHGGGRECSACGESAVMSAYEARRVYGDRIGGAYRCDACGTELARSEAPSTPPGLRGAPPAARR